MALKKDKTTALRSRYSAFAGGKSLVDHVGTDIGASTPSANANSYAQVNVDSVRGNTPGGSKRKK